MEPSSISSTSIEVKLGAQHTEAEALSHEDVSPIGFDETETKHILRKIDWRLVPILSVMYLVSFIDRANIGNARIAGLSEDLKLQGMQYNIALTVFFIPYALFEVPSNIVLKIIRPSIWLPGIMLAWGFVLTLTGIVHDYRGLIAARFFLGVAEAGFFPGATYLLTIWYRRYEVQTRMVFFFGGATLSGAFSGLLAYGIQHMKGIAGQGGWRWIFILEGIATCVIAIALFFILPDDPRTARFLTEKEREFVVARLEDDSGSGRGKVFNNDPITARQVAHGLRDWRVWAAILVYWSTSIGIYGFTYTVPTVIRDLGYSAATAQLLTIPIYVAAMIATIMWAIWSDRKQQRSPFIMGGICIAIVGFVALLAVPKHGLPGVIYGFLFFAASGLFMSTIPIICWIGNNLAPYSKRAVGMALLISGGNLGGIAGSNIYMAKEAPHYWTGYGFSLGICLVALVACYIIRLSFQRENARRDLLTEVDIRARYNDSQLAELGDKSPYFRYTL